MSFLDDDFLKDTETALEKREQEFAGDKREKMSAGSYKLILCKMESEVDNNGVPTLKLIMNKDADQKTFRDLNKYFKFDESDSEKNSMNKKMLVEFFVKAFGHKFKAGDLKQVIAQLKKYEGQKLSATVQVKQKNMKKLVKGEDGKDTTEVYGYMVVDMPQLYFVGKYSDDLLLKPEKKMVKLKESELEIYEDHKKEFPDRYDDLGKLIFGDTSNSSSSSKADDNDDPFAPTKEDIKEEIKVQTPVKSEQGDYESGKDTPNDKMPWD